MESNNQNFSSRMISPDSSRLLPVNLVNDELPSDGFSDRSGGSRSSEPKVRRQDEIFDAYHQIGSELKHSLKAFESNNLYLSNKLSMLQREIEILKRKRELQKTALVELQIKAEKLDQTKQSSIRECLLDKNKKLELISKEFEGVCEDDQYITETQGKIKELLENDKSDMEGFSNREQQEHANQIKFCDEYKKNTESTFNTCYERVKNAIEEEKNVSFELEEALQQCKNNSGLKEKYEYELQEKFSNLELIEKEVGVLKDKVRTCKEELNEILVGNVKLNDELLKKRAAHSTELITKQVLVEEGLKKEVEDMTSDLIEKETKLKEEMQENKYLSKQIENALGQIHVTSAEIAELNGQIDEMNKKVADGKSRLKELEEKVFELGGVHKQEERLSSRKEDVMEKLAAKNSIVSELENKLGQLQDKWSKAKMRLEELKNTEEEMKTKNESAKKELAELLGGLREVKESAILKKLERELSELKSKSQVLKEQIGAAEDRLKSATVEIADLEAENALLDEELKEVSVREEQATKKFGYFQNERVRLDELKSEISNVKEEVLKIKSSREFRVNVEHLKEEAKKVQQEIEQKKQQHEAQKESIQDSFKRTLRNMQQQMEELKEASEEEIRRRQSRTDRFQISIPQLQQEIQTCRNDLMQTTEKNIAMMRERLKVTGRLVESYRVLQAQSQSANGKDFMVVRLLGTIEEHLASSFRGMVEYLEMTSVDLTSPSYFIYRRTLDNFERRFNRMTSEGNQRPTDPTYLAELKLAAFCLFGLRHYPEVAESDSTFFSPGSSSIFDF